MFKKKTNIFSTFTSTKAKYVCINQVILLTNNFIQGAWRAKLPANSNGSQEGHAERRDHTSATTTGAGQRDHRQN